MRTSDVDKSNYNLLCIASIYSIQEKKIVFNCKFAINQIYIPSVQTRSKVFRCPTFVLKCSKSKSKGASNAKATMQVVKMTSKYWPIQVEQHLIVQSLKGGVDFFL